jgi:hypothetical protein
MHEVEEEFVFLSATEIVDPLLLNLLEIWGCLMLQTLTRNALAKYLPLNAGTRYPREWIVKVPKLTPTLAKNTTFPHFHHYPLPS